MATQRIIHLYNEWHLGDSIFTMNYLHQISQHLIDNNIHVIYYCNPSYKIQLGEFVASCKGHVVIEPLAHKPAGAIDVWIKHSFTSYNPYPFNDFLLNHTNRIADLLSLPRITSFYYTDPDLAYRYYNLPENCKNVDILFINALPNSGQYRYNKAEWDIFAHKLKDAGYKIVSTSFIKGIESTIQHSLTVKDIGAISTHARYIIAVNSGPIVPCLNATTMEAVRKWFIFDTYMQYKYPTMTMNPTIDAVLRELVPKKMSTSENHL